MSSGLTRREVIAAMLGAPALALVGCRSKSLPPNGKLLAPDHKLGHRVRDGIDLSDVALTHEHQVVIVGGGVAGLGAAWRLLRAGVDDFVVLELEQHPGGTAHSGHSEVAGYPWGAHYVPVPTRENAGLVALFDEMDLFEGTDGRGNPIGAEHVLCRDPQERVFVEGGWLEGLYPRAGASQQDLAEFQAFRDEIRRIAAVRDENGGRPFAIPLVRSSAEAGFRELDELSMADWLQQHGWTSERLKWYVDYACRDDYGMTSEQTSAWAGLFYFVARIPEPDGESQPFLTWPEGNGHIVNYLAGRAGDRLKGGRLVAKISSETDSVVATAVSGSGGRVESYRSQRVVFAAPQFTAPHIVSGLRDAQPWRGAGFEYGSWIVANVHLADRPSETNGFALSWDNVIHNSASLGYVVATHQSGRDHGPSVWTWYYPFCDKDVANRRQLMLDMDWSEWADVVLTDLERAHPDIRPLVQRVDIMRWGHAMIRPRPGFIFSESRVRAAELFERVHFAGTDLSGLALMEEAWFHGLRAAEEVLGNLGVTFEPLVMSDVG